MSTAIISIYSPKINPEVIWKQRLVFNKFKEKYDFFQLKSDDFAKTIDTFLKTNRFDNYLLFAIDSIPLTDKVIPYLNYIASKNKLVGAACEAYPSKAIVVGTFCMAFSRALYTKIGMPSFRPTERGGLGAELSYLCQEQGHEVSVFWPTSAEIPNKLMSNVLPYGIGTTYDQIYHHGDIAIDNGQRFIDKCKEVLGEENAK